MMCVVAESQQRVSWIVLALVLTAGCSYQDCVLPMHPEHGKHVPAYLIFCPLDKLHLPQCKSEPGTPVPDGWFLYVRCDQGFVLRSLDQTYAQSTCIDTRWKPPLPSCIYNFSADSGRCAAPPHPQNGKYKPLPIECGLSNRDAEEFLVPGTFVPSSCVLLYECNPGYELDDDDVISICVNGEWNPKTVNCKRGSSLVLTRTNSVGRGCVLPKQPQNRRFCKFRTKECYQPGSLVTDSVIKVHCDYGYGLANNVAYTYMECSNGSWSETPKCLKLCPPLESDSVLPQCQYGTTTVDCSQLMLNGTIATFQCRSSYSEYPGLTAEGVYKRTISCRQDGKWSKSLPECKPVCGLSRKGVTITPTIIDGTDTQLGEFPWHAGLYLQNGTSWDCICGGSLISNHIVLTAAHCVRVYKAQELKVALGKYYRNWNKEEEGYAVKFNVSLISFPEDYHGSTTEYGFDIALLLLKEKVKINSFIMPVCRNPPIKLDYTQNITGYVVGWGRTEVGKESEVLLHSDLTIQHESVCKTFLKSLTIDKFCGYKGASKQGSVAQKGDSGGGLTTIINDLHYIVGIVSVKIKDQTFFTNISWNSHPHWLENQITRFEEEIHRFEK